MVLAWGKILLHIDNTFGPSHWVTHARIAAILWACPSPTANFQSVFWGDSVIPADGAGNFRGWIIYLFSSTFSLIFGFLIFAFAWWIYLYTLFVPCPSSAITFCLVLPQLKVRANGHKNSQHFCANNVGNCCVRVGSGVKPEVHPFV